MGNKSWLESFTGSSLTKKLMMNPLGYFIYTIIAKWYIMIIICSLVVTFWVFKGLNDIGVLTASQNVVVNAFNQSKSVAQFCVPKMLKWQDFWDCLQNPPEYKPIKIEQELEKLWITDNPAIQNAPKMQNPYDD